MQLRRDGPSRTRMLLKANHSFKFCQLFKDNNRNIAADNFSVRKPNSCDLFEGCLQFASACADWECEWCKHGTARETASHALAATLPSYLDRCTHEAFLQKHYLIFVLNHALEGTCVNIRGCRQTVASASCTPCHFRSQLQFHSPVMQSSRGQGASPHNVSAMK